MGWNRSEKPSVAERAVSALCYLTGGIIGIIYIIVSRSHYQSDFFRFHFLQSIVIVILTMLIQWARGAMGLVLGPLLPGMIEALSTVLPAAAVGTGITVLGVLINAIFTAFNLLAIYGLIWAALGKYAEIPFLSNVVRQQMR
ncbi:MAG: hypothetical protein K2X27_06400 [Candidatus Obscuribacterales bacterium]|nr:hypothetical protein [Candidatus Obscuribacterales bacterium]